MIFKEAVKSKVRLSITGYEEVPISSEDLERLRSKSEKSRKYGWHLEPPSPYKS